MTDKTEQFKRLVFKNGLSLVGLARRLGVSISTVHSWSQGTRVTPDYVINRLTELYSASQGVFKKPPTT